ncbi:hypothetical protein C1645_757863 [Glomus cerebriforme]|uniref:Uncharacterized protein n=1 Tax=Glomus cerebriforme TaxID=658196 RepID=A0A397TAI4_9GLOM|nr:hypothetical protein C1645_757863 [Glomus cerebriforme]
MPIITPIARNLRKRNFEQLRPYTAERIHAKNQGVPVEVDKEVLRRDILENYGGYIEDEIDLSFVENDIGESQEVQRLHSEQGPQQRVTNVNYQNARRPPAISNKSNASRNNIHKNMDSMTTSRNVERQYIPLYSDDVYQEWSEDDENITAMSIDGDLNYESSNEEIETEFSCSYDYPVSISSEESITSECEVNSDPVSTSSDESITSNNRDECELDLISLQLSQSSRLRMPEHILMSKTLKDLLQWADTTPVSSPNDKDFPIEKYLELFEELHKNIYVGNPWPEQARSLIRDLMIYWAGWRPTNNGINNCYKILVKLIEVVPINAYNIPNITTLTQRYLDLTLQLLGRIIDDTPIDHVEEFISKFNKHTRALINNLRCKGVQDKANENITVAICSVIALINKKPMCEHILNKFTYISKRNQEWIIKSLMLLNQTLKMLTSYGTDTKQTLLDLFELLKRKCRDERMGLEVKIKAKECLETVKAI